MPACPDTRGGFVKGRLLYMMLRTSTIGCHTLDVCLKR